MILPTRPITHPRFKYVPACRTDVRRTFRKFRLLARLQRAMGGAA
jgi:hypothetical protein